MAIAAEVEAAEEEDTAVREGAADMAVVAAEEGEGDTAEAGEALVVAAAEGAATGVNMTTITDHRCLAKIY